MEDPRLSISAPMKSTSAGILLSHNWIRELRRLCTAQLIWSTEVPRFNLLLEMTGSQRTPMLILILRSLTAMLSQPKKTSTLRRNMLNQNRPPCNQTSAWSSISSNLTTPASISSSLLKRMTMLRNGQLSGLLLSNMLRMMKVSSGSSTKMMEVFTMLLTQITDSTNIKDGSWLPTSIVNLKALDQSSQKLLENGFMNKLLLLSPLISTALTHPSLSGDNHSNGLGQRLVQLSFWRPRPPLSSESSTAISTSEKNLQSSLTED